MRPADVIAALQREDGLTLRRLFGRDYDDAEAMAVMDALIRNGSVTELDGRYYLRHSKLPPSVSDQAEELPEQIPQSEVSSEPPAPRKRAAPPGLRVTPESLARAKAEREALMVALEAADEPLTIQELVDRTSVPYWQVSRHLARLKRDGVAQTVRRGKWVAAPPGRAAQKDVQDERPAEVKQLHPALRALIEELPPPGQRWTHKEAFVVALTGIMDFLYPDCAEGG